MSTVRGWKRCAQGWPAADQAGAASLGLAAARAAAAAARVAGASLVLRARGPGVGLAAAGAPTPPGESTNFGLEQIRARLAALHGASASFTLTPCDDALGGTLAQVTLPLATMDAP